MPDGSLTLAPTQIAPAAKQRGVGEPFRAAPSADVPFPEADGAIYLNSAWRVSCEDPIQWILQKRNGVRPGGKVRWRDRSRQSLQP